MKQKFWKELKSRLCPRQTWLRDDACVRCQCCTKQFSFFRRKHHCRFCGKIFCSLCSDQYINGTYLGLSEKYVRHCQFCKQEIQKIKQDLNRLTYMVQDEQQIREEEEDQSGSSSDQDNCYIYIKHIFGSVQKEFLYRTTELLDFEAKTFNRRLLERFVETGHISKDYANSKILQLITTGVIQSKMNILPSDLDSNEDYMDINRFLSIKTVTGEPLEIMQLVNGIVLQKNFALKGMQTYYENPQIIVIQNSIDEGIVKLKFEELMTNVSSINQYLQQKIMRLNPDVVFVEKSINKQILKYCSENRVSILSGFKKKELAKICKIAGIRNKIKNIWNVGKYQSNRFTGTLDRISIKKINKNGDPLIYLEKNVGIISLVVSETTSDHQSTLKKALSILIKLHRQIELQKYLIYTDDQMWQQKQSIDTLKLHKYSFIYNHVLQTLKPPKLVFYKVCLSEKKISELQQKVYQFCLMKKKYYFFDVCGEGLWNQMQSYTSEDLTIGHFILIMATNFLKKCSYCGLSHRYRYYFNCKGVQMSAVSKKKRSEIEQIQNEQDLTIQKMRNYLKKYKQAFNVFSYFKCRNCPKIVTKKSKIGKNYLKNSFHYFLMLITSSSEIIRSETSSNESLNQQNSQDCKHKIIDRYIETSDILFKMEVFSLKKYKLDIIDLQTPQAASIVANNTVKFIEELIQKQLGQKKYFLDLIQINISSLINYLDPYKVQPNVSSKVMTQIQRIQKLSILIERSIRYLDSIQQKQMKKVDNNEIKQTTDWTYFLREMAKIEYVIKVALETLIASETKLQKYRKKSSEVESNWKLQIQEDLEQGSVAKSQKKSNTLTVPNILKQGKSQQSLSKNDSQDQLHQNEATQESSVFQFKFKKSQEIKSELKSQDKLSNDIFSLRRISSGSQRTFYQLQSNTKIKDFLKNIKGRRYQMKKGRFLYFNLLNYKDHFSILAYGLNSLQFYQHIQRKNSKSQDSIRLNIIVTKQFSTSWQVKHDIDQLNSESNEDDSERRDSYELIAFFHRQFEEVRKSYGISYQTYIRSLACSELWQNNSGGKSNSQFAKSKDSLLIIKTVKEQQFVQFQKFAQSYLAHINKKEKSGQDSFLAKIFGIYELTIKGKSFKCVVMQNMFFNIDTSNAKVYDLKGSEINRLSVPSVNDKNPTGLDTNFKIDKNHQPYLIEEKEYRYMWQNLQDDILFLSKNEVIDYSLLVIEKDKDLRIGVIDFMRPYHFFQKLQKTFKQLKYGHRPTVLPPQLYAQRFLTAFKQYFMPKKTQISSE